MAYGIPQETIERVRTQADIVQVISEYLTLKKAGGNFRALCPFHKEKTPSFMVSPSKQIFHCFGCGAGGNVFGFLMRQEGFTFPESVRFLAERVGIQVKEETLAPGQVEIRERLFELNEFARRFYCQCLKKSPKAEHAREYLKKRHLAGDAVREFSLGFAPGEWDSFLSAALKKHFSRELLLQAGLAKKSPEGRVYDAFRNRIMFPIWGLSGKVIAFGARALEENQPKYINSPETPIYHKGGILYNLNRAKKSISAERSVIVVEGYTDAMRLALSGIENVVASSGTAFTNAQARLIKRYAGEVVLVFDSDSAGMAAAGRGIEVLLAEDLSVRVAVLPAGNDPDEFVLEGGAEAFGQVIAEAKNFVEFHIESAIAAKDGGGIESKIKTTNLLATLVGKIPDPIRREEYLRLVSSRLDVKPEVLLQASRKSGSRDRIEEEVKHFERRLERDEKEYMWLVRMLMHRPECIRTVREHLDVESIQNEALRELFVAVLQCEDNRMDESVLFDMVQSERAQQMLSMLVFENVGPELMYPIDWWIGFIRSRQQENALKELSRKISEAESEGSADKLENLLKRKSELKRALAEARKSLMEISVDISAESVIGG
jgi:DNA primase